MRGIREYKKHQKIVHHYIYPENHLSRPDIFVFQETHSTADLQPMWETAFTSADKIVMSHGSEHSKGVLIRFAKHLDCVIHDSVTDPHGRYVITHVSIQGESFTIVGIYMDPGLNIADFMCELGTMMGHIVQGGNTRVIICGDFNAILDPEKDHSKGTTTTIRGSHLTQFMETHDLSDIWRVGHAEDRRYSSFQSGIPTRIDLALGSPAFMTHVYDSHIGLSYMTDHAPVFVEFSLLQEPRGKGYWRVPDFLLADPTYVKQIENTLDTISTNGPNLDDCRLWDFTKMSVCSKSISYLAKCHKTQLSWTEQIDSDIHVVSTARDNVVNNPDLVRHYSEQLRLMQIERDEILYSHTDMARKFKAARKHYEMNRSTHYYYKLPGSKYDAIKQINDSEGNLIQGTQTVLPHCYKFYSDLYRQKPHPQAQDEEIRWKFLQYNPPGMTGDQYQVLNAPITEVELHVALTKMKPTASPGSDGITVRFYLKFWHKISKLLFNCFRKAFEQGCMSNSQRRGILRLIPKRNKNLKELRNWRPITLLQVDYKILSKALAVRLATVLPSLIHRDQKGFVCDRYIGDNIYEIYSVITQADLDKEEGLLLLLDIEKAFDSVSLSYLLAVLENFNFPEPFIDWIRTLYHNKEIQITNHGHMSEPIRPTNGLAQGNGLSPLLFILTIETLALNIRANASIEGYTCGEFHKKLALLADDLILSIKANHSSLTAVLSTLLEFNKVSNLKVNYDKSAVLPIGPNREVTSSTLNISPFTWGSSTNVDYLGVSISTVNTYKNPNCPLALQSISAHMHSILRSRNTTNDTLTGRVLTLKAFISSKLNYYLALSSNPSAHILRTLQPIMIDYVWSYRWHHVNAHLLYRPFDVGGINMYSIEDQFHCLKLKAFNKLICNTGEYWQQLLQRCFTIPFPLLGKANLAAKDLPKLIQKGVTIPFYWLQVITTWCKLNYHKPKECPENSLLWANSAIPTVIVFHRKVMLPYQQMGIVTVKDFMEKTPKRRLG